MWIEPGAFGVGFLRDQGLEVGYGLADGLGVAAQPGQGLYRAARRRHLKQQRGQPLPLAFMWRSLDVDGDNTILGVGEHRDEGRRSLPVIRRVLHAAAVLAQNVRSTAVGFLLWLLRRGFVHGVHHASPLSGAGPLAFLVAR